MVVMLMYIDRTAFAEYPLTGVFSRLIDEEGLPLIEQTGGEEVILETPCDITESSHTTSGDFIGAKFVVYIPFDPKSESVNIKNGDKFKADFYGVNVNGNVVGVFPSQLGGVTVYIRDLDA